MPAPHPPEFHRRAVDLTRRPGHSVAWVTKKLGISESGLHPQHLHDEGVATTS